MPKESSLPAALAIFSDQVHYVQEKIRGVEWSSSCPSCGGTIHPNHEWPDRCIWRVDNNKPRGWCRRCGSVFWPDGEEQQPSLEDIERWRQEREEAELRRKRSAEHALDLLQQEKAWLRYHQQLDAEARARWESWGIPPDFQDYWKLGYEPAWEMWYQGDPWITATMTIPIFEPQTAAVVNVRHRLLNPPTPTDKYRPERAGLGQPLFVASYDDPIRFDTLLVEGEKKAMVSFIAAHTLVFQVIGTASKHLSADNIERLAQADPVYICLDPDAQEQAVDLAHKLGYGRCRLIELPDKIDDLIVEFGLGQAWMQSILQSARRP